MSLRIRLKIDVYEIFRDEIGYAIARGWARAHKHVDEPGTEAIHDSVRSEVMSTLCDLLDFDDFATAEVDAEFDPNEDPP